MPTAEVAPRVSVDSEEIMSALAHLMAAASVFCWLNGNTDSDLDGMLMDAYESLRIAAFGKTTGEDDLVEVETTARGHEIEATMLEKAADNLASIQKAIDYATRPPIINIDTALGLSPRALLLRDHATRVREHRTVGVMFLEQVEGGRQS